MEFFYVPGPMLKVMKKSTFIKVLGLRKFSRCRHEPRTANSAFSLPPPQQPAFRHSKAQTLPPRPEESTRLPEAPCWTDHLAQGPKAPLPPDPRPPSTAQKHRYILEDNSGRQIDHGDEQEQRVGRLHQGQPVRAPHHLGGGAGGGRRRRWR